MKGKRAEFGEFPFVNTTGLTSTCNYTNMVQACLAPFTVRVLARSLFTCMDQTSRCLYLSHEESVATTRLNRHPLALALSAWNLEQQTYFVYVFLYLSLHQNNFVTQSHRPVIAVGFW